MSQDDYLEQADIARDIWRDRPENIGGGLDYIDDQRELERVIADDREFGGVIPGQLRREAAEASADELLDFTFPGHRTADSRGPLDEDDAA